MYRQILVHPDDRYLQRIFWREDTQVEICEYQLNTVTYGLASSPFLATRCLIQLADENQTKYPEASQSIREDMYVDDLLTGGSDIDDVIQLKKDIVTVLSKGNFKLRKWKSNVNTLIDDFQDNETNLINASLSEGRTLGLNWQSDTVIILYIIKEDFAILSSLQIPRQALSAHASEYEIHLFSDASERGYGAAIYIRSSTNNIVQSRLLCAKSRVAPLKRVTLPRLELCAALLGARLLQAVRKTLINIPFRIICWSDSTIVLFWIKKEPLR